MKQKLIKLLRQLRGHFNSPLPTGIPEFDAWAASFSEIYDLPTKDQESIRVVLASILINLGSVTVSKPKEHFRRSIVAAASKQVAGSVFQTIQTAKFAADKVARRDAEAAASAKVVVSETK